MATPVFLFCLFAFFYPCLVVLARGKRLGCDLAPPAPLFFLFLFHITHPSFLFFPLGCKRIDFVHGIRRTHRHVGHTKG